MSADQDVLKAVSQKDKSKSAAGCLFIFFGLFFVVGCATGYFFVLRPGLRLLDSQDWVATPCRIVSSRVEQQDGDDGSTYRVAISYTYEFAGQAHRSDRYNFWDTIYSSGRSGKEAIVRQYPVGKETTCYVNPAAPPEAVIHRGWSWSMLFGLIPLAFAAVGGGGMAFSVLARHRLTKKGRTDWLPSTLKSQRAVADDGHADMSTRASGPIELKPQQSRWGGLIGMIFFSLFWNGITSVFVVMAVKSHLKGDPEWFLTIFIIPFVLVGIGTLVGIVYMFLKLFNPLPSLSLSNSTAALGGDLELRWQFSGNVQSIRRLQVTLRAIEEATYTVGTDTHRDRQTFLEVSLIDTSEHRAMQSGHVSFTIPADSMHSFDAPHNKIMWSLRFHGDIARWPDVDNEFPLVVLPAPHRELNLTGATL